MLIISYDAIGSNEFDRLLKYPAFNALSKKCAVFKNVSTVFLSNTYPVHTSVVTGVHPKDHGIVSNTEAFPTASPASSASIWNCDENLIRAKTIWQEASRKRIKTAAVLWPVTAFSKTINYNIPEVRARPGKSQIFTSLRAGSASLQLELFLRHRKLMDGLNQPNLDNFSAACMADILRKKKPGLALVHLTAYDSLCHDHGKEGQELDTAFSAMDKNLTVLLDAADSINEEDIILFSDHSQLNIHTVIDPNLELVRKNLIKQTETGYLPGEHNCFFELCGGSAFFHAGTLSEEKIKEMRSYIENNESFRRYLTQDEINQSGMYNSQPRISGSIQRTLLHTSSSTQHAFFGFCAKDGYCYEIAGTEKKGNHGYPLDMNDYNVFYMVKGCGLEPSTVKQGGSLLDIAPLVRKRLGL